MLHGPKYYEYTEYPEIYKKVYWGNFRSEVFREEEMITNRNNFIKTYNVKNVRCGHKLSNKDEKSEVLFMRERGLDHIELYTTRDGKKIQVCSQNKEAGEGWEEIAAMYSSQFGTYLRCVTLKQMREEYKKSANVQKEQVF
tara:strand:+ start:474 stop:896 length:423 start_codon:yes stop_codon:yes gene_type:complete